MVSRATRLRFRRRVKAARSSAQQAQTTASEHLEKHVVKRWQKFADVRRFVLGWLLLVGLLMTGVYMQTKAIKPYFQTEVAAAGGIYTEGVVGEITNLNPIFASSAPDKSVAALLFEPLIRYDSQAKLTPGLAESWTVSKDQMEYTLKLREGLVWHDGTAISAQDVVFTIQTIQHPDTQSPLNKSWEGIEVEAPDDRTVIFRLPNPFTPFLHGLTKVGILPRHVLEEIPPKELRSHPFNLSPQVGSGPFSFAGVVIEDRIGQVRLTRFDRYYRGASKLDEFILQSFVDYESLVAAFNDGEVTGAAGLRVSDLQNIEPELAEDVHSTEQFNNVLLFINTGEPYLKDAKLRQALIQSTDQVKVFAAVSRSYALSKSPLLPGQLGYSDSLEQLTHNPKAAGKLFDQLGWRQGPDGIRRNKDKLLEFTLVTQNSDEYPAVAEEIQRQWRQAGVNVKLDILEPDKLQQDRILPHAYQLLLIGIEQGVDPDAYVFWHSNEARVPGFNLSEYKNQVADTALEAGRTRGDARLRRVKYEAFLEEWRKDVPAIALYRPAYFYAQLDVLKSYNTQKLPSPTDRFSNVHNWTILTETVDKDL